MSNPARPFSNLTRYDRETGEPEYPYGITVAFHWKDDDCPENQFMFLDEKAIAVIQEALVTASKIVPLKRKERRP